jgi:hypothetical protein
MRFTQLQTLQSVLKTEDADGHLKLGPPGNETAGYLNVTDDLAGGMASGHIVLYDAAEGNAKAPETISGVKYISPAAEARYLRADNIRNQRARHSVMKLTRRDGGAVIASGSRKSFVVQARSIESSVRVMIPIDLMSAVLGGHTHIKSRMREHEQMFSGARTVTDSLAALSDFVERYGAAYTPESEFGKKKPTKVIFRLSEGRVELPLSSDLEVSEDEAGDDDPDVTAGPADPTDEKLVITNSTGDTATRITLEYVPGVEQVTAVPIKLVLAIDSSFSGDAGPKLYSVPITVIVQCQGAQSYNAFDKMGVRLATQKGFINASFPTLVRDGLGRRLLLNGWSGVAETGAYRHVGWKTDVDTMYRLFVKGKQFIDRIVQFCERKGYCVAGDRFRIIDLIGKILGPKMIKGVMVLPVSSQFGLSFDKSAELDGTRFVGDWLARLPDEVVLGSIAGSSGLDDDLSPTVRGEIPSKKIDIIFSQSLTRTGLTYSGDRGVRSTPAMMSSVMWRILVGQSSRGELSSKGVKVQVYNSTKGTDTTMVLGRLLSMNGFKPKTDAMLRSSDFQVVVPIFSDPAQTNASVDSDAIATAPNGETYSILGLGVYVANAATRIGLPLLFNTASGLVMVIPASLVNGDQPLMIMIGIHTSSWTRKDKRTGHGGTTLGESVIDSSTINKMTMAIQQVSEAQFEELMAFLGNKDKARHPIIPYLRIRPDDSPTPIVIPAPALIGHYPEMNLPSMIEEKYHEVVEKITGRTRPKKRRRK